MRQPKSSHRAGLKAKAEGAKTTDQYLAAQSPKKRAVLEKLRRAIKSAVPEAEECISYGVPAFRLDGKFLVAYAAAAGHCSFYPGAAVQLLPKELAKYETSKGTVRFSPDKPLPAALVRKLVRLQRKRITTSLEG